MRWVRLAAAVGGTACLLLGWLVGVRTNELAADTDHRLTLELDQRVSATEQYFAQATAVTLLSAHNPTFAVDATAPARSPQARARYEAALGYLETLFPGQISEACLIDLGGAELGRVVPGAVPGVMRLSPDERRNPFFAATLTAAPGTVLQARPYLSPDTREWVVSNSTVIRDAAGRPQRVIHFEVTLESLRRTLRSAEPGVHAEVVDAHTGEVLLDGNRPLGLERPGTAVPAYDVTSWHASGRTVLGGRALGYARLRTGDANQNAWYVVASVPALPVGWRGVTDVGPLALDGLGLALLTLAVVLYARHGRRLGDRALRDELTGVGNRRALKARLARSLDGRADLAAVLLVDLDHFKHVNDSLGHAVGDVLLVEVARRLQLACGPGDLVTRLGGDEFGILLAAPLTVEEAVTRAREVVRVLEAPAAIDGLSVQTGGSVGVAMLGLHGQDVDTLLRRADLAMYDAKRRRTGVSTFAEDLERRAGDRLAFEATLFDALERDELVLHYQPQVDLRSGRVTGVEALVRWQHPQHGLLYPDRFIPTAEETGLIVLVTKRVLALALDQVVAWRRDGLDLPVAVNLGARDVADPQLPVVVAHLLEERGLPSSVLHLELTETDVVGDPEQAHAVLAELRALGVVLAVDDFGTGFASLSQLRQLPFDELKIDRSFVAEIAENAESRHLVDSIVELGHGLGLSVIAEGVETEECRTALVSMGCDTAQGYGISRPLTADALFAWVSDHHAALEARGAAGHQAALPHLARS